MSKIKKFKFMPILVEGGTSKKEMKRIWKFFSFNFILKLCIKLFCQLQFCLSCICKVRRFGTPNPCISKPIFVDKNEFFKSINLQLTPLKCNEDFNNLKKSLHFDLGYKNPKDLSCQHSHGLKLVFLCMPPI
jgi:hypothetical protein